MAKMNRRADAKVIIHVIIVVVAAARIQIPRIICII
jgi:hypothetical protein